MLVATFVLVIPAQALAQGPLGTPVDLTYAFDEGTIYWPTAQAFDLQIEAEGMTEGGYWYAANSFHAAEHGGTHLDAPIHFAEGRRAADQIPLADLMGPAVVIDATEGAVRDPDYLVDVEVFMGWESTHGRIPNQSIILLRTGWGDRWPEAARYLGTAERGSEAVADLHFPGLHPEAASWLLDQRGIRAIGIDTASIDRGQSTDFLAHQVLAEANVPIFENVAHLDLVPPTGAWVIGLPMKIARGTGGPLRLVAFLPESSR